MTTSPAPAPAARPADPATTADPTDELAAGRRPVSQRQLIRLIRRINSMKVHAAAKQRHGIEFTSYVLLFQLVPAGRSDRARSPSACTRTSRPSAGR